MATELAKRVMVTGLVVTLPLALAAAIFFGPGAGAGVIGGLVPSNFGGLAREAWRTTTAARLPWAARSGSPLWRLVVSDWPHLWRSPPA